MGDVTKDLEVANTWRAFVPRFIRRDAVHAPRWRPAGSADRLLS
jgi:hypothetical protein